MSSPSRTPCHCGREISAVLSQMRIVAMLAGMLFIGVAVRAEDAPDAKFTSGPAVAARGRYSLLTEQARKQLVTELKAALKENMQAGQLEEANRISKIVDSNGEASEGPLTSSKARAAQNRFNTAKQAQLRSI